MCNLWLASGLRPELTVPRSWGGPATAARTCCLGARPWQGMAATDGSAGAQGGYAGRLDAKLGYGFVLFGGA